MVEADTGAQMKCGKCQNQVGMLHEDGLCVTCYTIRDAGKEVMTLQRQPIQAPKGPPEETIGADVPLRGQPETGAKRPIKRRGPGRKPKENEPFMAKPKKRKYVRRNWSKEVSGANKTILTPVDNKQPVAPLPLGSGGLPNAGDVAVLEKLLVSIDEQLEALKIQRYVFADKIAELRK